MKKLSLAVIAALLVFSSASAETLLGKDYVGGSFGTGEFNNPAEEIFDNRYGIAGEYNKNLSENLDLNLNAAYGWANSSDISDDFDATERLVDAELRLFQCPGGIFNPFVNGGVRWGRAELGKSYLGQPETIGETDAVVHGGVGAEYEITSSVLSRVGVDFADDGQKDLNAFLGYWLDKNLLTQVKTSYDIDGDDSILTSLGLVYTLN